MINVIRRGRNRKQDSLAVHSSIRFVTEVGNLLLGLVAGIILARSLGPAGKGTFSTLTFLFGIFGQTAAMGLEESAIVLISKKKVALEHALRASITVVIIATLAVSVAFWGILKIGFHELSTTEQILAAATIPFISFSWTFTGLLNSQLRVIASAAAKLIGRAATTAVLFVIALIVPVTLSAGLAAEVVGFAVALAVLTILLTHHKVSFLPRWDPQYLRSSFWLGSGIQLSRLLSHLSARLDLLVVYWMGSRIAAGHYSVALTIGQLVAYVPYALIFAAFPRIAARDEDEAIAYIARLCRTALAAGAILALAFGSVSVIAIPLAYGPGFKPAVGPSLVLLLGGLLWTCQFVLCRSAAARGNPRVMLASFGLSVLLMLALDLIVVPLYGAIGAALVSVIANAAGLTLCVFWYRRTYDKRLIPRAFIPRTEDIRYLVDFLRSLSKQLTRRAEKTS